MSDILAAIPLSAIRVFEAAARLRSFTRAAQELGITQAAVSWQVKALEKRLDQPLFLRLPREVTLTAAGERLARAASEAVGVLRTALMDITETGEGVLSITSLATAANQWLAPRIGAFQLKHPSIAVRLDTSTRLVDLAHENFDVAVRSGEGDWPGIESHYLFPHIHAPLCTPAMRERLGGLARPEDLLEAPLIGSPQEWAIWFAAVGVGRQDAADIRTPRIIGDSQTVEVASALGEQGVALACPFFFNADMEAGRLVMPFKTVAHYGGAYWLAYRADRARAPKIRAFRECILDCVAQDPVLRGYPRREP